MDASVAQEIFGDVISTYTRAQAQEDGALVDVSRPASKCGIRGLNVSFTRDAWSTCVPCDGTPLGDVQTTIVLARLAIAMRTHRDESSLTYAVKVNPGDNRVREVVLSATMHHGDEGEPVLTVALAKQ